MTFIYAYDCVVVLVPLRGFAYIYYVMRRYTLVCGTSGSVGLFVVLIPSPLE